MFIAGGVLRGSVTGATLQGSIAGAALRGQYRRGSITCGVL